MRIIGKVEAKWNVRRPRSIPARRLHVRAIIRDGARAFVGSQSLRRLELEKRREVGIIVTDENVVKQMQDVFEKDWALTDIGRKERRRQARRRPRRRRRTSATGSTRSSDEVRRPVVKLLVA